MLWIGWLPEPCTVQLHRAPYMFCGWIGFPNSGLGNFTELLTCAVGWSSSWILDCATSQSSSHVLRVGLFPKLWTEQLYRAPHMWWGLVGFQNRELCNFRELLTCAVGGSFTVQLPISLPDAFSISFKRGKESLSLHLSDLRGLPKSACWM